MVDRRSNYRSPRVADGGDSASHVHQVHHTPAKQVAKGVCIVGQSKFGVFRGGFPHGASFGLFTHGIRIADRVPRRMEAMATDRLEILRTLVEQNPGDSRTRYMLAMELSQSGQFESAAKEYAAIIANDADYVAAYYHGGQVLEKLGRL